MSTFSQKITLGRRTISRSAPAFVIAEAGVNHNGKFDLAKKLIDAASFAHADAVKFQTYKTEHLILKNVDKAPYQKRTAKTSETQYDMLRKLEFLVEDLKRLQIYARKKNILLLTTPFEEYSLNRLGSLQLPAYKVASTDLTNIEFLRKIAAKGKPVFLSTGMSYMSEVEIALEAIAAINSNVVLLQCTANYPINDDEVNLNVIKTYARRFGVLVGYSDHTTNIDTGAYAVACGAVLVEKHFTLDKTLQGPDHQASLTPQELALYVKKIRLLEAYMGTSVKFPTLSEQQTRVSLQKYLVAAHFIAKGSVLKAADIVAKRTGGKGISPVYYQNVVGKSASRTYKKDDIIEL